MNRRQEITQILRTKLGIQNVYFQPPEDLKMKFPCVRYKLSDIKTMKADNMLYNHTQGYELVYITREPDNILVDTMLKTFDHISFSGCQVINDLYHYRYKLYY